MAIYADMGAIMQYVDGDRSEEMKEKVFEALRRVYLNIVARYAPDLKFDYDFRMDLVTDAFDRLHRPFVDFRGSKWRTYAYVYTAMRNALTGKLRRKEILVFDSQSESGGRVTGEADPDPKASAETEDAERRFVEAFALVAGRMIVFQLAKPTLAEAYLDMRSPSGICSRAAMIRELGIGLGGSW